MANLSKTTQDHEEIRRWAEERGAHPACVKGTGDEGDIGILRLDFPGYTGEESLTPIEWDEWFEKFDDRNLALLYQEETAGGERSNFNKIVSAETAEAAESGSHRKAGSDSKRSSGGAKNGSSRRSGGSSGKRASGGGTRAAKKTASSKSGTKVAAKKAEASKKAPAKKAATKKAGGQKGPAKNVATKKAPAKKVAAKKAPAKKVAAKKTAAKKTTAKKSSTKAASKGRR